MREGHRSRWTPEEDSQLLELIAKNASVTLISAKLKRTSRAIRMRLLVLQKNGRFASLPTPENGPSTEPS
jgi:hypothetical protein